MPTIVLRNSSGQDVGFLLGAGNEPWATGQRDCILMSFPAPPVHPLAKLVAEPKHTEFQANICVNNEQVDIQLRLPSGEQVLVSCPSSASGTWSVSGIGDGVCVSV